MKIERIQIDNKVLFFVNRANKQITDFYNYQVIKCQLSCLFKFYLCKTISLN